MTPTDPLAQLNPLREAQPVSWWPPAPGWWLAAALLLLAACWALWWLWRRHRRNAYRRQGLAQLAAITEEWQAHGDSAATLADTNALLKAVALQAYPAREVAAATGAAWCELLNRGMDNRHHFSAATLQAQYHPQADASDVDAHLRRARHWIRHHRVQHD